MYLIGEWVEGNLGNLSFGLTEFIESTVVLGHSNFAILATLEAISPLFSLFILLNIKMRLLS